MRVCKLMGTRRARTMVVGALSEAGNVGIPCSMSPTPSTESCTILGPTKTEEGSTITATQPQQQSKKQRQNAQRREAQKEAKRERDAQQQAALSSHKREVEGARRVDQAATSSKRTGSRYDSLHLS